MYSSYVATQLYVHIVETLASDLMTIAITLWLVALMYFHIRLSGLTISILREVSDKGENYPY